MKYTSGIDVGSTYTKAIIIGEDFEIAGSAMVKTGFQLEQAARTAHENAMNNAGVDKAEIDYIIATGFGRHQVSFSQLAVTDLTASARGAIFLYPNTRTVLDVGGQTMKASRLDENAKVQSFRLNDKCAAGTGAFLEKTAFYMGYDTQEVGPLVETSKQPVSISGVCAVFAESEVINHLSQGSAPADIMHGAVISLVDRSVQLMKRVRMEPEYTLVGGILQFQRMCDLMQERLGDDVNVPPQKIVQYVGALGAAILGHIRLEKLGLKIESAASIKM